MKNDLSWWIQNITVAKKLISHGQIQHVLRTDASSNGWGAAMDMESANGRWTQNECQKHINELELLAVMFGLKSLCHNLHNTHIQLQIDNTTAVCYLQNFGGCRSQPCNDIARSIWLWCIEKQLWITASHLPGSENIAADSKSRIFDDTTEWMLSKSVFEGISTVWGPFKVDMFASRLNAQVNDYVSYQPDPFAKHVDAFTMSWTNNYFYAFPPFSCINLCLSKILEDEAECVMIVPVWPTQTWYPRLMDLLIDQPRTLPVKDNLLTLPHSKELHPLRKKLQLIACRLSGKAWKQEAFRKRLKESYSSHGDHILKDNTRFISKSGNFSVSKGILIPFEHLFNKC